MEDQEIKGLWTHDKTGRLVLAVTVSKQHMKNGTTEEIIVFRDASYTDLGIYHKEKQLFLDSFSKYEHEARPEKT